MTVRAGYDEITDLGGCPWPPWFPPDRGLRLWYKVEVHIAHGHLVEPPTYRWRTGPAPLPFAHRRRHR